jgi:hypothetical protein
MARAKKARTPITVREDADSEVTPPERIETARNLPARRAANKRPRESARPAQLCRPAPHPRSSHGTRAPFLTSDGYPQQADVNEFGILEELGVMRPDVPLRSHFGLPDRIPTPHIPSTKNALAGPGVHLLPWQPSRAIAFRFVALDAYSRLVATMDISSECATVAEGNAVRADLAIVLEIHNEDPASQHPPFWWDYEDSWDNDEDDAPEPWKDGRS